MAKYYATIAGLPNIGVEDRKLPLSVEQFIAEVQPELTSGDAELFRLLLLEEENRKVVAYLKALDENQERAVPFALIDSKELTVLVSAIKNRHKLPRPKTVPQYIKEYLLLRYPDSEQEPQENDNDDLPESSIRLLILEEDRLSALYHAHLLRCGNRFIRNWAELNLNLRNVLSAYICRQLGWSVEHYIVGDNEVAQRLRSSSAKDFGITSEEVEYISRLTAIAEERDITRRERLIDVLRWEWLEEQIFFKPFDIEALLTYYLQLSIVNRWLELNEKKGEETFRAIVQDLKRQSTDALNEFKRNQKK